MKTSRRSVLKILGAAPALSLLRPTFAFAEKKDAAVQQTKKLRITNRTIEVNGKSARVYGLIGDDGKSGLRFTQGEQFKVQLINEASKETLIHWHGLTPPWKQDGVPDVTQKMLQPGKTYDYDFTLTHAGTNWMHAHTLQEQEMLAAPLIISSADDLKRDEQEVVIMLHDFSFKTPEELLSGLQKGMPTAPMDHSKMAMTPSAADSAAMANGAMDMNDIAYDAYLANDRTLDDPEIVRVEGGGHIRLRIINGATSTGFTIDLGELDGELIAVDGMDIVPVKGKHFPLIMAQRLDVRLTLPKDNRFYPILALREGAVEQTGIILAPKNAAIQKLATKAKTKSPVLDLAFEQTLRAQTPLEQRAASVDTMYHLHGMMMPYKWFMNRVNNPNNEWLKLAKGDRVKIRLMNESIMAHPIHLHGHHFQVVGVNDKAFSGAVRDTVIVPPNNSVDIMFDANNPGNKWAFHCHHLYHMVTGMMNFVEYKNV